MSLLFLLHCRSLMPGETRQFPVCARTCECVHVCACVCCVCIHAGVCIHVCTCLCACVGRFVCTCVHMCVRACACVHVCTCACQPSHCLHPAIGDPVAAVLSRTDHCPPSSSPRFLLPPTPLDIYAAAIISGQKLRCPSFGTRPPVSSAGLASTRRSATVILHPRLTWASRHSSLH